MTEHLLIARPPFRDDWPTTVVVYRLEPPCGAMLVSKRASGAGLDLETTVLWIDACRREYLDCRVLIETGGPGELLRAAWLREYPSLGKGF